MANQEQEEEYLKNLLKKHENKGKKIQNYLKLAETSYQQKIKTGNFQIKQSSDIFDNKETQRNLNKIQAQNMRYMKRSLEKNLKMIDSRIEQLTQPDKRSKSINEEQRLKFVSQMAKARKDLQKNRQKKIQDSLNKDKQIIAKEQQQQRKKQEEARHKRKEQIMKRAQSLEIVRKNKKVDLQNQNKQLKQKMQEKVLYEKMLQKFKQKEDITLQQRKKKLAQIRSFYKPITKSQFQLHLQKIDRLKSQRSRVIDKNQVSKYITNDSNNFYKSKWYKKNQQQQKIFDDQKHREQIDMAKQMKEKLKKYGQYVRQNFKPEIDGSRTKSVSTKQKSQTDNSKIQDLRKLGLKYLQWSKSHINPNKKNQQNDEQDKQKKAPKKINYLEDLKKNSKGTKNSQEFIQQLKKKKNLTQVQKAQKILDYVEGIQRKAKMRQQKGKINKVTVDEQLDNMYIQAIAVKLSMLGKDDS